jgi:hypothetical protein
MEMYWIVWQVFQGRFIQIQLLLPPLKPMAQSQRGVTQVLEAQAHPLTVAISRFIQLRLPLLPLRPTAQSRRGVTQVLAALRAAKATEFE